jgi:hypothetical protein
VWGGRPRPPNAGSDIDIKEAQIYPMKLDRRSVKIGALAIVASV